MRFPYAVFPAKPNAAFPNRVGFARPILSVLLEKNGKSVFPFAIVDSGADTCIFPASLAGQLGIAVPNQNAYVFSGTAESPQIAYFETVRATIWNDDPNDRPISFNLQVGFCESLEHVGLGLLGQEGFFSRFKISFDHSQATFEIRE